MPEKSASVPRLFTASVAVPLVSFENRSMTAGTETQSVRVLRLR